MSNSDAAFNIDPNYDFFFDIFLARLFHNSYAGKKDRSQSYAS